MNWYCYLDTSERSYMMIQVVVCPVAPIISLLTSTRSRSQAQFELRWLSLGQHLASRMQCCYLNTSCSLTFVTLADCSPPGSYPVNLSQPRIAKVGWHSLSRTFQLQGSNPLLLHLQADFFYHCFSPGSPSWHTGPSYSWHMDSEMGHVYCFKLPSLW